MNGTTSTGADARQTVGKEVASKTDVAKDKERVISPELRQLLSRKVVVLDKKAVVESGGGVS